MERSRRRLDSQGKLLSTLGHHNVLARGFALVRSADGSMLRRAVEVRPGAALDIEFADGHVGAHADGREPEAKEPRKRGGEKQGTLL
jgi:exodeoxyribonuclease VII large subunit